MSEPLPLVTSKDLRLDDGVVSKNFWAVAVGSPAGNYETIAYCASYLGIPLVANNSGGWYTAGGWSHRCYGVASEVVASSGLQIFEGTNVANAYSGIIALGYSGGAETRCWSRPVGFFARHTAEPSSQQRTDSLAALRTFFSQPA